jgi:hypothetical protein
MNKLGENQLSTEIGRALAIVQLTSKHSGEIVEIDRTRNTWILVRVEAPGSASGDLFEYGPQWNCLETGEAVGGDGDTEYGKARIYEETNLINVEMQRVASKDSRVTLSDLGPDWGNQTQRIICPCISTELYEWRRCARVSTLGELFFLLGEEWPASTIYQFYRTLRVIALKRRKTDSATSKGPASGSPGLTGSSLQAATIRKAFTCNKDLIIEEYVAVQGLDKQLLADNSQRDSLYNEAVLYIHMILLRDMRPPWLLHTFPQALPGEGLLSQYTRPSFLQWEADDLIHVFGVEVTLLLHKVAETVSLQCSGAIARPLYVCTALKGQEHCMSMASMSSLLQQNTERGEYKCRDCMTCAPVSDSEPMRALHVYALVSTGSKSMTPLRMKSIRLLVSAPPESWAWGVGQFEKKKAATETAKPILMKDSSGKYWKYNANESSSIWFASGPFQSELSGIPLLS